MDRTPTAYTKTNNNSSLTAIDVSAYQQLINWKMVSESVDAAILRVGFVDAYYGGGFSKIDPYFKHNQVEARKHKVPLGYYYYAFSDSESPIKAAHRFVTGIGELKDNENLWIDIEDTSEHLSAMWVKQFIETVEYYTQRQCHVYTVFDWIKDHEWIKDFLTNGRKLWLGLYAPLSAEELNSLGLGEIMIHQYNLNGRVPGIRTNVDINKVFGSIEDWNALAKPIKTHHHISAHKLSNALEWPKQKNALYIEHCETGRFLALNENDVVEAASVIKIPVVLYTLEYSRVNHINLDTKLQIKPGHRSNGSGIIAWTDWEELTIRQLILLIAEYSDCTATNCLVDFFGGKSALNKYLLKQGYKTRLLMESMQFDDEAVRMPDVGSSTAKEATQLTKQLLFNDKKADEMRKLFQNNRIPWFGAKITASSLGAERVYIKTGSLKSVGPNNDSVLNFTGLAEGKHGPIVFCCMNRYILGPGATELEIERAQEETAYYFVHEYWKFVS